MHILYRFKSLLMSFAKQNRQCTYQVILRRIREYLLLWKSNIYYIFFCACVYGWQLSWACACGCACVALLIQHITRMRHSVMSFEAPLDLPYFFTLSLKRRDFEKNALNVKFVLFSVQLSYKRVLILRRIQRDIVINVKTSSCKVPVIIVFYSNNNSARYCHKCENIFM